MYRLYRTPNGTIEPISVNSVDSCNISRDCLIGGYYDDEDAAREALNDLTVEIGFDIEDKEEIGNRYYRLLRDQDGQVVAASMDRDDEYDYDQSRFIGEERYSSEEAALAAYRGHTIRFEV